MVAEPGVPDPIIGLRDPRATAALASRWTLDSADDQDRAAHASLMAMPTDAPGLVRYSVYRGLDDLTLFHLSQWKEGDARDHYVDVLSHEPRYAVDAKLPDIERNWRELVVPYRNYVSENTMPARCLVVVRQPMKRPDTAIARDWIDTEIRALLAGKGRIEGPTAANFLVSVNGDVAIDLAEWSSADSHRAALQPAHFSSHGSFGEDEQRQAAGTHPGVTADHEAERYALVGVVAPA